jgi:hypothetical protein
MKSGARCRRSGWTVETLYQPYQELTGTKIFRLTVERRHCHEGTGTGMKAACTWSRETAIRREGGSRDARIAGSIPCRVAMMPEYLRGNGACEKCLASCGELLSAAISREGRSLNLLVTTAASGVQLGWNRRAVNRRSCIPTSA